MSRWIAIPKKKGSARRTTRRRSDAAQVKEGDTAASEALRRAGLTMVDGHVAGASELDTFRHLNQMDAYVVATHSERSADQAMDALDASHVILPSIVLTTPRPTLGRTFARRPARHQLWTPESGIGYAHKHGVTGKGVLVGVLDTGCDADHAELIDKRIDFRYVPLVPATETLREVRGFDVDGHGTHVCGVLAGKHCGVAPGVDLIVASAIESETLKTTLDRVLLALNWMLGTINLPENREKPAIINMSIGFTADSTEESQIRAVLDALYTFISTLLKTFEVLPVISIGNDGPGQIRAPGYFTEALSVGAVDFNLSAAEFSGGGRSPITGEEEPDIAGYGVEVISSKERTIDGQSLYASMSGTSMAAPYVTGIAALVASNNPQLQGELLRQYLLEGALPIDSPRNRVGAGLARFL